MSDPAHTPRITGTGPGGAFRILLVEDSFLVAHSLARMLQDLGAEVVGPAGTVHDAVRLLETVGCDGAILDVNLGRETVEPVADRLVALDRPFFFITGYSSPGLRSPEYQDVPRLRKPVDAPQLLAALQTVFGAD